MTAKADAWLALATKLSEARGCRGKAVEAVPQLKRGQVWCFSCGATQAVGSARCLATGWPKCCGSTMSIDSPEERRAMARQTEERRDG